MWVSPQEEQLHKKNVFLSPLCPSFCFLVSIHPQPGLSLSSPFCYFLPSCSVSFLHASLALLPHHPLLFLCCSLSQFPSVHCFHTAPSPLSLYLPSSPPKLRNASALVQIPTERNRRGGEIMSLLF